MSEFTTKRNKAVNKSEQYYEKASNYFLKNKLASAKKELRSALHHNPNNVHALILYGDVLSETESYKKALKYYDLAIKLEKHNPDPYFRKANTLIGEGKYLEAEKLSYTALKIFRNNKCDDSSLLELILDGLANSLIMQKKFKEAKKILNQGIKQTKSDILIAVRKNMYKISHLSG